MARRPLYEKDQLYKRNIHDTKSERDQGYGLLIDLKNKKPVKMYWDFNEQATADGIFRLVVGEEEVYLDAEQVRKYLRWV